MDGDGVILQDTQTADLFNALYNHSGLAIIYVSLDDRIVSLNYDAEHLLTWRAHEVKSKNFFEISRYFPLKDFSEIKAGKTLNGLSWSVDNNDDELTLSCSVMPVRNADAKIYQILIIAQDVTISPVYRDQLAIINSYLYGIVDCLPHFIFWKDKHSKFLGCNKLFAQAANLRSPSDIVNSTDYDMPWDKEQADRYRADDKTIIETGKPKLDYEEEQTQKDSSIRVMLVNKIPLYDAHSQVMGLLGFYTDITARKESERALIKAQEQGEIANQVKLSFVRDMEHDIRTPFVGVHGTLTLLLEEESDFSKKELLQQALLCTEELLSYCDNILDFSRIESESLPLFYKSFELRKLIDSVMQIDMLAAKHKSLEFFLDYDLAVPDVLMGDPFRLQRILLNLVGNAIKFTQSGSVKLSVRCEKLAAETRQCLIKFDIEDTGEGIPESKKEIIFERFTRLSPSNKGLYKGLGLGLKIVKQFVEEMNADIHVHSVLGQGTKFTIYVLFKLPLSDKIID